MYTCTRDVYSSLFLIVNRGPGTVTMNSSSDHKKTTVHNQLDPLTKLLQININEYSYLMGNIYKSLIATSLNKQQSHISNTCLLMVNSC